MPWITVEWTEDMEPPDKDVAIVRILFNILPFIVDNVSIYGEGGEYKDLS